MSSRNGSEAFPVAFPDAVNIPLIRGFVDLKLKQLDVDDDIATPAVRKAFQNESPGRLRTMHNLACMVIAAAVKPVDSHVPSITPLLVEAWRDNANIEPEHIAAFSDLTYQYTELEGMAKAGENMAENLADITDQIWPER